MDREKDSLEHEKDNVEPQKTSKVKVVLEKTSQLTKQEKEKIKELLEKHNLKAKSILSNVGKTQELLDKVLAKMENVKFKPIAHLFGNIRTVVSLIGDTVTGKYKGIPYRSIIAMTGALIYFLSPIDIIPDFIPVLGLLDDTFVLGFVLKQFEADINVYKAWKTPKEELMIELKKGNIKDDTKGFEDLKKKLEAQKINKTKEDTKSK